VVSPGARARRTARSRIDDNDELSPGDIAAVKRLYAFFATSRPIAFCNAPTGEVCMGGDFDGNGRQDLISFHHDAYNGSSEVWVALSDRQSSYLAPRAGRRVSARAAKRSARSAIS
jgi:hypothetical protein